MGTTDTKPKPKPRTPRRRLVAHLAGKLGFETIESRNLDRLDFRDVGVAALRGVLGEAIDLGFELGYRLGEREAKMRPGA